MDGLIKAVNKIEIMGTHLAPNARQRFEAEYNQEMMVKNYLEYFRILYLAVRLP